MNVSHVTRPSLLHSPSSTLYETPSSTPRSYLFPSINGNESMLRTSITIPKIQQYHSIILSPIKSPLSARRVTLSPLRSGSPIRTYSTPPRLIATLYETPLPTTNLPPPFSLQSPSLVPHPSLLSPSVLPRHSSIVLSPPSSLLHPPPSSFPPHPSSSCLLLSPSSFLLPNPQGSIYNNVETMRWMLEQKDIELKAWKKHAKHLQKHVKKLMINKVSFYSTCILEK